MKRLHLFAVASSLSLALTGVLVACASNDTIITSNDAGPDDDDTPDADKSDANEPDAPPPPVDAGLTPDNIDDAVAEKLCNALTKCCYGDDEVAQDAGVDGGDAGVGFFDRQACLNLYTVLGFEGSSYGLKAADKSKVTVNQAKAVECLAKIDTLTCDLAGSKLKDIRATCFDALEGTVAAGEPCTTSVECASGTFCDPTVKDGGALEDGGVAGHCTALRGQGENCSILNTGSNSNDSSESEIACSTRGGGDTGRACQSYDPDNSPVFPYKPDRANWTCQPAVANGKGCNTSVSCGDGVCDPVDFVCKPAVTYIREEACKAYLR